MYEMRNTHILQLDELNSPEYRDEGKKSVEQAYDAETGEPTKTSEAQEILLNLILNLGGIRKEVWEYLITPRFQEPQAVASVGRLLCYAAPLEWMELSVEALSRMAGTMYVNEITEAYQSDIPFDEVKHIFEISDTVFEMCQRRREYCKKHEVVKRQHPDNMTGSEEKQHPDSMTGSEERQHLDNMTGSERTKIMTSIEKTVVNAVTEALQLYEKNTGLKQHPDSVTGSEEEEHPGSVTGSEEEEHPDSVTGSEKIKPSDNVTGSNGYIKEQRTRGNRKYVKRTSEEYSMSDYLRDEIDSLIMSCKNFEEFEQCMKDAGYDIKYGNSERYGKYMAVCNSEMQRFRRTHTLGEDYTLSMIKKRIELFHSELPQNREKTSTESWILISKKIYYCSFRIIEQET